MVPTRMYEQSSNLEWPIIKYKEIKRERREEHLNVRAILVEPRRALKVVCGIEELEHIYLNMDVSKYPSLKMKGDLLYVLVNKQGQGFRLTFHSKDRSSFMTAMRKVCYISETPEKNHMNRSFTNTAMWAADVAQKKGSISFSQPVPNSYHYAPTKLGSPQKKSARRNLATSFKATTPERAQMSPYSHSHSPVNFYSQPVRNSYPRPVSSASSVSSSISSAFSSLNEEGPYLSYPQSPRNSCPSSYSPEYRKSPYSNSQCSDPFQPSYTTLSSPDPTCFSRLSDHLSQPSLVKSTENKSVQTDTVLIDQLIQNPDFMNAFMLKMTKSTKVINLVRTMRSHIRSMDPKALDSLRKRTESYNRNITSSQPSTRPPPLVHLNSDSECDVFATT